MSALATVLKAQADALELQAQALRALAQDAAKCDPSELIDQHASPLGPRRHCTAVKRRVAKGQPGASIVGRKHYLSPDAIQQELSQALPRKRSANDTAPRKPTPVDELDQKLKLLAG